MNREEKEQYVIQLYKEDRSTREIAKLTHMSFRDIVAIIKKVKLEANAERGPLEVLVLVVATADIIRINSGKACHFYGILLVTSAFLIYF
jgi:predicted DNA-binding protein YlxM (UPF0122 family)